MLNNSICPHTVHPEGMTKLVVDWDLGWIGKTSEPAAKVHGTAVTGGPYIAMNELGHAPVADFVANHVGRSHGGCHPWKFIVDSRIFPQTRACYGESTGKFIRW